MRNDTALFAIDAEHARRRRLANGLRILAMVVTLGVVGTLAPIGLSQALGADISQLRITQGSLGATQSLRMSQNKSLIVDVPIDVQEVIVSQPAVASAILRSKRRVIVQSVGAGDTNILLLDGQGRTVSALDISVKDQVSGIAAALQDAYTRLLPNANIRVDSVKAPEDISKSSNDRVVLSGFAPNDDDREKAIAIAQQFAGDPARVTSVIMVGGPQQVMLKVTVAEVNRSVVKQLGMNITGSFNNGGLTTGLISTQPTGGASAVLSNNSFNLNANIGGLTLDARLRALEQRGALRTLAEPTLTAMSGQSANFLAGGEFPVPTEMDKDGKVTYTYKEFGVKLDFTPTIKSGGTVGLLVDTTVSEPTTEGSVSIGGLTIPGIKNRQAKTTVELGAGQTLAIGGLMQETMRTQINRIPGLGDIPILGTLFRSRDFIRSQTELMILVTPYLAKANTMPTLPTDNMVLASDAESMFLGHIEKIYGVGNGGMRGGYDGTVGFILD